MALLIILMNIFWWQSARYDAREEVAWSFPYRMFDWNGFQSYKQPQSDKAHKYGAFSIGALLLMTSLAYTASLYAYVVWWMLPVYFILSFVSFGLVYWRYFDIQFSIDIGMGKYYLGGTAKLDKWLVKRYGRSAGKKKALFSFIGVSLVNAAILLLYFLR